MCIYVCHFPAGAWPRLQSDNRKPHWIKTDFDHFEVSESEEEQDTVSRAPPTIRILAPPTIRLLAPSQLQGCHACGYLQAALFIVVKFSSSTGHDDSSNESNTGTNNGGN